MIRLNNNLSECFVCRYLDIELDEYIDIEETGDISGSNLVLLSKLYNCTVDSFFIGINSPNVKINIKEIIK